MGYIARFGHGSAKLAVNLIAKRRPLPRWSMNHYKFPAHCRAMRADRHLFGDAYPPADLFMNVEPVAQPTSEIISGVVKSLKKATLVLRKASEATGLAIKKQEAAMEAVELATLELARASGVLVHQVIVLSHILEACPHTVLLMRIVHGVLCNVSSAMLYVLFCVGRRSLFCGVVQRRGGRLYVVDSNALEEVCALVVLKVRLRW